MGRRRSLHRPQRSPAWTEPGTRWLVQRRSSDRTPALSGLPQADQEALERQLLSRAQDVQILRAPRPPEAALGGQRPGRHSRTAQQPSWEWRLLWFLELSGVVEDGTDVEEARAARMDGWIAYIGGRGEGRAAGAQFDAFFFFSLHHVKGNPYPELCAQRAMRVEDFFIVVVTGFLCFYVTRSIYPLGMNQPYQKRELNKQVYTYCMLTVCSGSLHHRQ